MSSPSFDSDDGYFVGSDTGGRHAVGIDDFPVMGWYEHRTADGSMCLVICATKKLNIREQQSFNGWLRGKGPVSETSHNEVAFPVDGTHGAEYRA